MLDSAGAPVRVKTALRYCPPRCSGAFAVLTRAERSPLRRIYRSAPIDYTPGRFTNWIRTRGRSDSTPHWLYALIRYSWSMRCAVKNDPFKAMALRMISISPVRFP